MQRYYVIDREIAAGEHGFDEMVARAYASKTRPFDVCAGVTSELDLPYLASARRPCSFAVARTGPRHAPNCDHYEAPDHLTGLGQSSAARSSMISTMA